MLTDGGRVQASCTLCNGLDSKAPLKNSLGNLWKTCPMLPQWFTNSTACTQVNLIQRRRPGVLELCRISFSLSPFIFYTHSFTTSYSLSFIRSALPTFRFTFIPVAHFSAPFRFPSFHIHKTTTNIKTVFCCYFLSCFLSPSSLINTHKHCQNTTVFLPLLFITVLTASPLTRLFVLSLLYIYTYLSFFPTYFSIATGHKQWHFGTRNPHRLSRLCSVTFGGSIPPSQPSSLLPRFCCELCDCLLEADHHMHDAPSRFARAYPLLFHPLALRVRPHLLPVGALTFVEQGPFEVLEL